MNRSCSQVFLLALSFLLLVIFPNITWGAEARVQIRSPKDGSEITQEQNYVLVSGKVASESARLGTLTSTFFSFWMRRGAQPSMQGSISLSFLNYQIYMWTQGGWEAGVSSARGRGAGASKFA